ncbi:hypothetical protein HOD75_00705 [archaeon]|jgi:hypothetical protein|nr:hypothetical protein [archaeon]MBT4241396.1 hypothetical protein [archaeon]MBT4418217.1 hypothetical protein [archaeon]
MAWTPGISPGDLESEIIKEIQKFYGIFDRFLVYGDSAENARDALNEPTTESQKKLVSRNLAEHYRRAQEVNSSNNHLIGLYDLYRKYFPDSEFEFLDEDSLIEQMLLVSDKCDRLKGDLFKRTYFDYFITLLKFNSKSIPKTLISEPELKYVYLVDSPRGEFQIDSETWRD